MGVVDVPEEMQIPISFGTFLIFFGAIIGTRMWLVQQNQRQDETVRQACAELSNETGQHVEYRTRWTGMCKPKNAQPYRAIVISPGSPIGAQAANTMMVQVPEGSGPGTTLQVQTPQG